ncbi:MAG: D-sedoheptulose 7-phosphate isomerase [Solirubrobacteraceae bacterium]|jgi:D-sedoheptulose 7-phosphate isomerase|nr:D-sedoheptulose 7-phosphate isomerase [Solirubrobacteraceae bacterium]
MRRTADIGAERVETLLRARADANAQFFTAEAERLARLCHKMAERFAREGRLVAFGASPADRSDARHVAVEFVHPVIVGKRALPALGLAGEGGAIAPQVALEAEAEDIAMAFGAEPDILAALAAARDRGCLTIAFTRDSGAEWEFDLGSVSDPLVRQEIAETLYHTLWEHVHIFLDNRGLLEGRAARPVHDSGASSFLYPFLGQQETDLDAILEDVRQSILMKADEITALRTQTLTEYGDELVTAAAALRERLDAGGRILALGNGGSATDAMDVVADFREPMFGGPPRRALDLTEDTAIITAIANDIGTDAIFLRQVIAYGRAGDVLITLSTSGNSLSVLAALREARKRDMVTIAFVGYDGGNVEKNGLADHVIISRSENIPRIQEAHASGYHVLRELVELAAPAPAPAQ